MTKAWCLWADDVLGTTQKCINKRQLAEWIANGNAVSIWAICNTFAGRSCVTSAKGYQPVSVFVRLDDDDIVAHPQNRATIGDSFSKRRTIIMMMTVGWSTCASTEMCINKTWTTLSETNEAKWATYSGRRRRQVTATIDDNNNDNNSTMSPIASWLSIYVCVW